jgi:hypothetical protein
MRSISLFFRFSPVRLIALLLLALPVFVSAQSAPVPEVEQRIRVIKGLQLRLDKLLPMAGKEMSAQQEAVEPFLRESYKRPGEMASGPDADRWYRSALKLNRIADDMIAGGDGTTGRKPWKQFTPEDLSELVKRMDPVAAGQQAGFSAVDTNFRKMALQVNAGELSVGDFIDGMCLTIGKLIAKQKPPLTSPAKSSRK